MISAIYRELKELKANIRVVDNDLTITAAKGVVSKELLDRVRRHKSELMKFVAAIEAEALEDGRIPCAAPQPDYPLSSAQHRLWVLSQTAGANVAYHIGGTYTLEGNLDRDALQAACRKLVARHEILRTSFKEPRVGEARQFIHEAGEVSFIVTYEDLRQAENPEAVVTSRLQEAWAKPFDLNQAPLMRAGLWQLTDHTWILSYVMHHIIGDGWSTDILIKELLADYNLCVHGENRYSRAPLRIHYKDYAVWQQHQLSSGQLEADRAYWMRKFDGKIPVLQLPADKARPATKTYRGNTVEQCLSGKLAAGLREICRQCNTTFFMGWMAVVNTLLYRYTGQEDIIIGTPAVGRAHSDLEDQLGCYVNTLALRAQFSGDNNFIALLGNVKQVILEAYQHQNYPFDALVDELNIQWDPGRNPLFDVMVALYGEGDHSRWNQLVLDEVSIAPYQRELRQGAKFDLVFDFFDTGDDVKVTIGYNCDIYSEAMMLRLANHVEQLVASIIADPLMPVCKLAYLNASERHQLLVAFNTSEDDLPAVTTITQLFEEQVRKTPSGIALICGNNALAYSQVNETCNQLGDYLRKNYAVQPEDLIGIKLPRNEWWTMAVIGALKAGGAYVPIDIEYPEDRIRYMIEDSKCKVVIDERELERFRQTCADYTKDNLQPVNKPGDLCYVIYTSGTTGNPKGVMIEHQNLAVRIAYFKRLYGLTTGDNAIFYRSCSFDGAIEEYLLPLMAGATSLIATGDFRHDIVNNLIDSIARYAITKVNMPPALLAEFIQAVDTSVLGKLSSLRHVVSGGDKITTRIVKDYLAKFTPILHNTYGPTENTIDSTHWIASWEEGDEQVSIGKPIPGSRAYILDSHLQPVPVGVLGEIHVAGPGLSRGYLNQPVLTREKFITDPFYPQERMYRTGDLGKWQADGNIIFMGRNDEQVKVRGYRIELGEIEHALLTHPEIEAAAVMARSNAHGENELVAYVVSKQTLGISDIRLRLSRTLPAYMIPAYFLQLPALPLTLNGKLDRKKLPEPHASDLLSGIVYVAPRNETEHKLAAIWEKVLDISKAGVKDDFFELGGHSLKATRLANEIYKEFEVRVPLRELLTSTVLEEQARFIERSQRTAFTPIPARAMQAHYPLSGPQRLIWLSCQFEKGNIAHNIRGAYRLKGNVNRHALEQAFQTLVERHETLRTVFKTVEGGEVRQFVKLAGEIGFQMQFQDLTHDEDVERTAQAIVYRECEKPFDLESGPLIRATLLLLGDNQWLFAYVMHHIISDGWSMKVLTNELFLLYHACNSGTPISLHPLPIQYKDYVIWQQEQLAGGDLNTHKAYWLQQFEGELPVQQLPVDVNRPAVRTYEGRMISSVIDPETTERFKRIIREKGCTLFMGILAAVKALLYKYNGQGDVIVGTSVAGRAHIDLKEQIGYYLNTLALRTRFKGEHSYYDLLDRVKQVTLDAFEHQLYPFDELVSALNLELNSSRNHLFDVLVLAENAWVNEMEQWQKLGGIEMERYESIAHHVSKFDLTFSFMEGRNGLELGLEFSIDLFTETTARQLSAQLRQLIHDITLHPSSPIDRLNHLVSEEERKSVIEFNSKMESLFNADIGVEF